MAPPGFSPPGYTYEHIPQRFQDRMPVPAGMDTNTRAYTIFFSYLLLCFSTAVYLITKLLKNYASLKRSRARLPQRTHVRLFTGLAVASLLTTWGFMFQYFRISYQTWLMWRSHFELDPHQKHWGLWLRETSLFREAWETAIVGNARYWWTHQIFFFAVALGLSLEQKGIRRGITYTWAFMLLGQIVAISFATNIFLLTLLLSPPPSQTPTQSRASSTTPTTRRGTLLGPYLLDLFALLATQYSATLLCSEYYWHHPTEFMPLLLTPHIALLVLPTLRAILPSNLSAKFFAADADTVFVDRIYTHLWRGCVFGGLFVFVKVSLLTHGYSGIRGVWDALLEHPAVSSVGFDVVFCWITWVSWAVVKMGSSEDEVLGTAGDIPETHGEKVDAGSGTSVLGGDGSGGVRRR